ncbi:uncharacterized protein LOC143354572 [Halictus rubicundus]|uniref:uncharacterized protein LOC143354572 n=1 Tax=Halictus rubicundus TaxID=77578 RepID=UPI004035D5BE
MCICRFFFFFFCVGFRVNSKKFSMGSVARREAEYKRDRKYEDHHRKPYPCYSCGRSYTRKDTLRRHMRDECGKNPQYICYVCKKGFKQKSNFQRHSANVHGFKI